MESISLYDFEILGPIIIGLLIGIAATAYAFFQTSQSFVMVYVALFAPLMIGFWSSKVVKDNKIKQAQTEQFENTAKTCKTHFIKQTKSKEKGSVYETTFEYVCDGIGKEFVAKVKIGR